MTKIALVFGGTGGIGSSISNLLSQKGIKVYSTYYEDKEKDMKRELLKNCILLKCDIKKEEDIKNVLNFILKNDSKVDIIINAISSKLKLKLFEDLTKEEFIEDIETILIGSINLFKIFIPYLKKDKAGLVINLLTETVINPPSRMSSYVTAKSGLMGLIKSLANELKSFNIHFYNIYPSFVETDLIKVFPEKILEFEKEKQFDKKLIQPEDIAELILDIICRPEKFLKKDIILKNRGDIKELLKS